MTGVRHRCCEHFVADPLVNGHALPRDRALVHRRVAFHHHAVYRDAVARPDYDDISRSDHRDGALNL